MKKLILGAAFLLAFAGTAIAQTDNKTQSTTTTTAPAATPAPTSGITVGGTPASVGGTPATVGTPAATTTTTAPATTTTATAQQEPATATDGKEYNKVTQNQIAAAVLKKAVAKYKDYALVEALAAADGSDYKLVLTKDGKDIAAYYKPNGDFIKEETV
jgi:hypothetical protein